MKYIIFFVLLVIVVTVCSFTLDESYRTGHSHPSHSNYKSDEHPRKSTYASAVLNCSVCQPCMDPKKACQSSCRQCCFRCGFCRCDPTLKRQSQKYLNAPLYADHEKNDDHDNSS